MRAAYREKTWGGSDGGSGPVPVVGHTLRDRAGAPHRPDGTSFTSLRAYPIVQWPRHLPRTLASYEVG